MKPDWKDAPPWADWLTFDVDGWYWFEFEPKFHKDIHSFFKTHGQTERASGLIEYKEPRP